MMTLPPRRRKEVDFILNNMYDGGGVAVISLTTFGSKRLEDEVKKHITHCTRVNAYMFITSISTQDVSRNVKSVIVMNADYMQPGRIINCIVNFPHQPPQVIPIDSSMKEVRYRV